MLRRVPPGQEGDRIRTIMVIYGTRPEAVKMAPMVWELTASPFFTPYVAVTGQHRSMLDQVNNVFGISPDIDLDIHQAGQTLTDISTRFIEGIATVLTHVRPDAVVVQGNTATTFAGALAAYYHRLPVAHMEARSCGRGIGTRPIRKRSTAGSLPSSPRSTSLRPRPRERTSSPREWRRRRSSSPATPWSTHCCDSRAPAHDYADPGFATSTRRPSVLLVTAHRRESWGEPLRAVGKGVADIAGANPDLSSSSRSIGTRSSGRRPA